MENTEINYNDIHTECLTDNCYEMLTNGTDECIGWVQYIENPGQYGFVPMQYDCADPDMGGICLSAEMLADIQDFIGRLVADKESTASNAKYFTYLDELRDRAVTDMCNHAITLLREKFPDMHYSAAKAILWEWMRHRKRDA